MNHDEIARAASEHLGRDVDADFVRKVVDGDPFVFARARNADNEAAAVVLGLASGRLDANGGAA
jgi:hypothetical protein